MDGQNEGIIIIILLLFCAKWQLHIQEKHSAFSIYWEIKAFKKTHKTWDNNTVKIQFKLQFKHTHTHIILQKCNQNEIHFQTTLVRYFIKANLIKLDWIPPCVGTPGYRNVESPEGTATSRGWAAVTENDTCAHLCRRDTGLSVWITNSGGLVVGQCVLVCVVA